MRQLSKKRMCKDKATFRTKDNAKRVGAAYGQREYECPICFCWHLTTKEHWQLDYVEMQEHLKQIRYIQEDARLAVLAEKHKNNLLNIEINKLRKEVADAKKRAKYSNQTTQPQQKDSYDQNA